MLFHSCDKAVWVCLETCFYLDYSLSRLCVLLLGGRSSAPEASEALGAVWGHLWGHLPPSIGGWRNRQSQFLIVFLVCCQCLFSTGSSVLHVGLDGWDGG